MDLKKLLSVNMATLAALGTLLLAMGQRSTWAAVVVWLAAVLSIALTDFAGRVRLNRNAAAVAALAVVFFYFRSFLGSGAEGRILVLADLLVWLQVILLFQEKEERVYRWLAVMSLLQVVVAAGFSQGVVFGVLLVLYMLTGLSALTLLFLYGQWSRYRETGTQASRAQQAAETESIRPARWPLAAGPLRFTSSPAGGTRSGVVRELFTRLGVLGVGTLVLSLVIFFTVPRLGQTAWRGLGVSPRAIVGFEDTVRLGDMGPALEDRSEVMQVKLTDRTTGELYPVQDDLYLRGTVVTHYERNQWSRDDSGPPSYRPPSGSTDAGAPTVIQTIAVEPLDRDELFCLWPFQIPTSDQPRVHFDRRSQRLKRDPRFYGRRFEFALGTTAMADGGQAELVPSDGLPDPASLLKIPDLPQLTALAERWVADSGLPPEDHRPIAEMLERQLAESGRFQYSLKGQARDPQVDAVEDFVSNNPRGHCEYFATALALMLRSQGIPSRVVLGYRCDEWNDVGKFYQVRQLHAHAWVEAYLEPRQLAQQYVREGGNEGRWRYGGWLRLDGTPAAEVGTQAAESSAWGRWQSRFHRLQELWDHYVMEMDRQRQRETVVQPLQGTLRKLRDPQWWRETFSKIADALRLSSWNSVGAWLLGVAVPMVFGLLVLAATCWGLWRAGRRLWQRWLARRRSSATRSRIEFYRRLESLLERRGLVRSPGETPREFALAAGAQLARQHGRGELASLPLAVVEAFYQVRFGRQSLRPPQAQAVQRALAELEGAGKEKG